MPVFRLTGVSVELRGPRCVPGFVFPGVAHLACRVVEGGKENYHYPNSLVKHVASTIALGLSKSGCHVIDCCESWLGDLDPTDGVTGLVENPGRVLFAIHGDDLITEAFVRSAVSANLPLFAVLSADPECPYFDGGIDYEYDPQ